MTLEEALGSIVVTEEVIMNLEKEKYVISTSTPYSLLVNPEVIFVSLENDFESTMDFLNKNIKLFDLLTQDRERFKQILMEKKFVFKRNLLRLIKHFPELIIYSLRNDFNNTIEELLHLKNNKKLRLNNPNDLEEFRRVLNDNSFVLKNETIPLILKNKEFLFVSLINDYKKTMEVLNNCLFKVDFSLEDSKTITAILKQNDFIYDKSIPKIFGDKLCALVASLRVQHEEALSNFKYCSSMSIEEKDWLLKSLSDYMIPYASYTNEMIKDPYILYNIVKDSDAAEFIYTMMTPKIEYRYEDELRLLSFLNSKSMSLEEEIKKMHKTGLEREYMSLMQLLVFVMFTKKELYKNNITGYDIDLFSYDSQKNSRGAAKVGKIYLYNGGRSLATFEMVLILFHEINHAIQFKMIQEGRIDVDNDIDIYSKDSLIDSIIGDDSYYNQNYESLSFEFDADFKAHIDAARLLGMEFQDGNDVLNNMCAEDLIEYSKLCTRFSKNMIREYEGEEYHLDDLFDIILKREIDIQGKKTVYYKLKHNFPIIIYDYDFDCDSVQRRSVEDLVDIIDSINQAEEVKSVCAYLLVKRLSYQDKAFEKNEEELTLLLECRFKLAKTRMLLNKVLYKAYEGRCDRYLKYIDMINRNNSPNDRR